jgi:hypothetical protein
VPLHPTTAFSWVRSDVEAIMDLATFLAILVDCYRLQRARNVGKPVVNEPQEELDLYGHTSPARYQDNQLNSPKDYL